MQQLKTLVQDQSVKLQVLREGLTLLPKYERSFSEAELDVIAAAQLPTLKIKEYSIERLNEIVLLDTITIIHVITGWKIPDDPNYIKALCLELCLMLKEDFFMLNFEEIKLAFRKNRKVQDWGKSMNLSLIADVLGAYCSERTRIGEEERRLNYVPPTQIVYDDEQIQNQRRAEFEITYQALRNGYFPIIFDYYEELLVIDGIMELGDNLHEFISRQLNNQVQNIYIKS